MEQKKKYYADIVMRQGYQRGVGQIWNAPI